MKKSLLLLTALAIALSWACNRIENDFDFSTDPVDGVELTIHATQADASATRTVLMPDKSIYWTKGDAVNVFYGSQSYGLFSSDIEEPARTADFTGTLSVTVGSSGAGAGTQAFWGVYPYDENNTCDGSSVTLTLPSRQEALAGSFANKLNPSVATSSGLSLAFYNVGAPFYFSVTQEGVTSATFRGNNNEDLAGRIRVSMNADGCPVAEVLEGVKSITLSAPDGETFEPGTTYVLILLPQTFSAGYTVTFNKGVLQADCAVSKNVEFKRAKGRTKMDADEGLTYLPVGEAEIISFADDLVKSILVDHFDLDGDGEISTAEAAVVTTFNVPKATKNSTRAGSDEEASIMAGKDIEEFDEFVYFTGFTAVAAHTFEGCSRLKAIVLPETVIHLGDRAFYDCSSLHSVTVMSPTPPTLGVEVFGDDPSFTIYVPDEVLDVYRESWSDFAGIIAPISEKEVIAFRDPVVKALCVANWDTDGDGELSYDEAAAVKSLNSVFSGNQEIQYFEEFQYFTGIKTIDDNAFSNCSGLNIITLPEGLTAIGNYAFSDCSLSRIVLPESVERIGEGAFCYCRPLGSINIPSLVTKIESHTFEYCNLRKLDLGNISSIGEYAFAGNEFRFVSVEAATIGDFAFSECSRLEYAKLGCVQSIGEYAFAECTSLEQIVSYDDDPAPISIAEGAFYGCSSLITVSFKGAITTIGEGAFSYCSSLTDFDCLTSPDENYDRCLLTSIGWMAFAGCTALTTIYIPDSVTSIGDCAFSECESLLSFGGKYATADGLYLILDGELKGAAWASIDALNGCVEIPDDVTSIGEIFSFSNISSISLPESVESLDFAFCECSSLTSVDLNSVSYIYEKAFYYCTSLTSITLPETIRSIGYYAFAGCSSLTGITILANEPPALWQGSFDDSNDCPIYVPAGALNAYLNADNWDVYASRLRAIPNSVTGVTLDKTSLELIIGDSAPLTATLFPESAYNKSVTWKSSNESVATVDSNGLVTGVGAGNATITVTTADGGISAVCSVTVTDPYAVTGVTLDRTTVELIVGNSVPLTATVSPEDAHNKAVTWRSSNESIATVDSNGLVTGVHAGNATITVITVDGGFKAVCSVTVKNPSVNGGREGYGEENDNEWED